MQVHALEVSTGDDHLINKPKLDKDEDNVPKVIEEPDGHVESSKSPNAEDKANRRQNDNQEPKQNEAEKEIIKEKKEVIREQIDTKQSAITEDLNNKTNRLCQERSERINGLLRRSTTQGGKNLKKLQRIEGELRKFVREKQLASQELTVLNSEMKEKERAAVAALEVAQETPFDCATQDASNVGARERTAMFLQQTTLREYRDVIKRYVWAVKQTV